MRYIVFDENGKILRWGGCGERNLERQLLLNKTQSNEFVMEGLGEVDKKVEFALVDGVPENPRIVNMTPNEIAAASVPPPDNGPVVCKINPEAQALITNGQLQDIINRLETLENK